MKYAKSRPTQSEFVAAWWDEQEEADEVFKIMEEMNSDG